MKTNQTTRRMQTTQTNRMQTKRIQSKAQAVDEWSGWGWSVFLCQIVIAFGFLAFALTKLSFAAPAFDAFSLRSPTQEVQGEISWANGTAQIKDSKTGKVYSLVDAKEIKTLYDSGVRQVAMTGESTGVANTLSVERISRVEAPPAP